MRPISTTRFACRLVEEQGHHGHEGNTALEDSTHLNAHGVNKALVGESLLREENPGNGLRTLLGTPWK